MEDNQFVSEELFFHVDEESDNLDQSDDHHDSSSINDGESSIHDYGSSVVFDGPQSYSEQWPKSYK